MSEEHEPSYYVNEGVDSFESGLWDGPGADAFDPYTRFDVNFDFEAAFGLTTSESAGLEVPDQAAADVEQTQEACGAENDRDASDNEAFVCSTLQQPCSGTENETPADSLNNSPDPVRSLGHMEQPSTLSTPGEDSRYNNNSTSRRMSHTMALPETQFQEGDVVQNTSSISDPALAGHAQYWSSEIEDHSPAGEGQWVQDHEAVSNFQSFQGSIGQEQLQSDLNLGNQDYGHNASDWEFPIEAFFVPINTDVGLQEQPNYSTTQSSLVIGHDKDDDPHDSDEDEDYGDVDGEYDEEEDLPSQAVSVTYPVNDPLIVEDPVQKGWGRTGMRDGSEVWFNPKTYKWRKWPSPVQSRLANLTEYRTVGVAS